MGEGVLAQTERNRRSLGDSHSGDARPPPEKTGERGRKEENSGARLERSEGDNGPKGRKEDKRAMDTPAVFPKSIGKKKGRGEGEDIVLVTDRYSPRPATA